MATVLVACTVALGVSAGIAGALGLVIAGDCLAALALLALLSRTPAGGETAGRAAAAALSSLPWRRMLPGGGRQPPVQASQFPAFLKISSDLGWASVSMWHYDHGTRPLLARVALAALAERHRLDVATDPARARQFIGEDIWPLLDPAGPRSQDSRTPGPDLRTLARIIDRLERL